MHSRYLVGGLYVLLWDDALFSEKICLTCGLRLVCDVVWTIPSCFSTFTIVKSEVVGIVLPRFQLSVIGFWIKCHAFRLVIEVSCLNLEVFSPYTVYRQYIFLGWILSVITCWRLWEVLTLYHYVRWRFHLAFFSGWIAVLHLWSDFHWSWSGIL